MELGTERPSLLWLWGPNSMMVVYMDPLGFFLWQMLSFRSSDWGLWYGKRIQLGFRVQGLALFW